MSFARAAIITAAAASAVAGCGSSSRHASTPSAPAALRVTSPAFADGAALPRRFTCDGGGAEPPLRVARVPARAASLAVGVQDPDAPGGPFVHWVAFNLPPGAAEPSPAPGGARQARNDFAKTGYGAPCPPHGAPAHRYVFTVYALSKQLPLRDGSPARAVLANVRSAVIAEGNIVARYSRASSR